MHVAKASFSLAARGESDHLLRHVERYVLYPTALSALLQDLSVLATYHAPLRAALPRVWPAVMKSVLESIDANAELPGADRDLDNAIASMIPQPSLQVSDSDPDATLETAGGDWIDPSALSELIANWIQISRGSPRCVDALVGLVRTTAPEWQATVGLEWVADLIGDAFETVDRQCFFLVTWLSEVRSSGHLVTNGQARVHRIVDGLAAHGDNRALALQQAVE